MFRFPATRPVDPDPATEREVSVAARLIRVGVIMGVVVGAVVAAVAIGLPSKSHRNATIPRASLAAQRTAANRQWASATCTNLLAWKNEIARDEAGLLSVKALTRVDDAIAATKRMLNKEDELGLPPGAQTAHARAAANRLRTEVESRLRIIETTASSVANGNLAAILTLLTDLQHDKAMAPQVVDELRHVLTVDLGLSLAETSACRQLVGIPI